MACGPNPAHKAISSDPRRHCVQNEKINLQKLIDWQYVTYSETKTLRKMSGPQTVV